MFEQMKKDIKELREQVEKELDELFEMSNFLSSLKNVVEYANR